MVNHHYVSFRTGEAELPECVRENSAPYTRSWTASKLINEGNLCFVFETCTGKKNFRSFHFDRFNKLVQSTAPRQSIHLNEGLILETSVPVHN